MNDLEEDSELVKEVQGEPDVYVDFKGWRFRAPFRCMCCGRMISLRQFCFGRACGGCDCGQCRGHRPQRHLAYSGPRELIDPKDPYFITEDRWRNPPSGLEDHCADATFPEQMAFEERMEKAFSK